MLLASKYEEMYAPEIGDFVYITDNAYSNAKIRSMEQKILRACDYDFSNPLCIHFLRRISKAGSVSWNQFILGQERTENYWTGTSWHVRKISVCKKCSPSPHFSLEIRLMFDVKITVTNCHKFPRFLQSYQLDNVLGWWGGLFGRILQKSNDMPNLLFEKQVITNHSKTILP